MNPRNKLRKILRESIDLRQNYIADDLEDKLMLWAKKEVEKYIVHKASWKGYFKK